MNKKEWHKLRESIHCLYYHCKPWGTVCIAQVTINGDIKTARGVSIVHPNDNFCRKVGRFKARGWAEKALFHGKDVLAMTKDPAVSARAYTIMQDLFPFNYCNPKTNKWIGGFFGPHLTKFEQQILSKKKTKEIPIE